MLNLENTKIWFGEDKDLSKKVQERLFELGYRWAGEKTIKDYKSVYIDKSMYLSQTFDINYFNRSDKYKIIFYEDLFDKEIKSNTEDLSKVPYTEWRVGDTVERIVHLGEVLKKGQHIIIRSIKDIYIHFENYSDEYDASFFKLVKRACTTTIQDGFILPDKWYVKATRENEYVLKTWRQGNYVTWVDNLVMLSSKCWGDTSSSHIKKYTEITFEQFKKYVLKETSSSDELIKPKTNKQDGNKTNNNNENQKSERLDESVFRRETTERFNVSFGGCGDGLETSNRERKIRSVQIGERTGSEGEGLCTRRRSQRAITV